MSVPTAPPETLRLSWWQRMLLPNLPFIAAIAVLFLAVGVSGPEGLLNDSDTGWHIVTGERILETGKLPRTDPYFFSKPGEPWFAWEWLSDVILGAAHGWLGLAGVVLLACLALAATAWMWCAFAIWLGGDRFVLSTLMSLAILSSLIHWHARPHLFSWIFLIGWLWLLEDTPARLSIRRLAGVLLFMVLWTNLHGSFFLAFFLAGAYLVEFWFTDRRRAAVCLFEFGAALLATFANPYGWQLHVHLYRYLSNSEMLAQIQEFQSPGFHGAGGLLLILLFLTATGGAVVCLEQRRYARTLVVALLVMIGLRSARGIPVIAFVALPLVTASVTRALERLGRLKPLFEESSNFGRIERQCNGAGMVVLHARRPGRCAIPAEAVSGGGFPLRRTPGSCGQDLRARPVWGLPDLPLPRSAESLLRWAERFLWDAVRERIPRNTLPQAGLAQALRAVPVHPRPAAGESPPARRAGMHWLAQAARGQDRRAA